MVKTIPLKSLSTGLVGLYPETHLAMDPDLVEVTSNEDQCVDCWIDPVTTDEAPTTTKQTRKTNG